MVGVQRHAAPAADRDGASPPPDHKAAPSKGAAWLFQLEEVLGFLMSFAMHAHVGDLVQPLPRRRVEGVQAGELQPRQEVFLK